MAHAYFISRLAMGIAVLVTLVAVPSVSHAEIVYTSTFVDFVNEGTYAVDLNADGITDFTLAMTLQQNGCLHVIKATEVPASGNGAVGKPLVPLKAGAPIGPSQLFYGGTQKMARLKYDCGVLSTTGPWPRTGETRYVGASFLINGETHYGWAAIQFFVITTFGPPKLEIRLTGYAYETVPGMAINAGQTK